MTTLVTPAVAHLPAYVSALERGWSPDNMRAEVAREQLAQIQRDPAGFLDTMDDKDAKAGPIKMPDDTTINRLPGITRWIWDDATPSDPFCGSVGFRWQPGGAALPAHVLGHIGFAVVPWKQRQGHAKTALAMLLPEAKARGLPYVELTTDPDNIASRRVIEASGGTLVERFEKAAMYGGGESLRYRIAILGAD
jgi:predicted acetyltransferase